MPSKAQRAKKAEQRRQWAGEYRAILAERFPKCFRGQGESKPPLKIGIYHDIRERCPDLKARQLSAALFDYSRGKTYQRNLVEGAVRLDLDGNPAGVVTAYEEQLARLMLDGRLSEQALHSRILHLEAENASLRAALERAHPDEHAA